MVPGGNVDSGVVYSAFVGSRECGGPGKRSNLAGLSRFADEVFGQLVQHWVNYANFRNAEARYRIRKIACQTEIPWSYLCIGGAP